MGRDTDGCRTRKHRADLVGCSLDASGNIQIGNRAVKGTTVPEIVFRTTQTIVTRLDRSGQPAVPLDSGTGIVGCRALATHLVQAVALARTFVVKALDELTGIEMWSTVTLVMQALAVEHLWPPLSIQLREPVKAKHVGNDSRHHFRDRRTTRHLDDRLVGNHLVDGYRTGRVKYVRLTGVAE